MGKQKVVMQISALKGENNKFSLELLTGNAAVFNLIRPVVEKCNKSYGGYIQIEVSPPYKKRTTGELSQNNLIWRLITLIANETGNDIHDVEMAAKERAVKRGYPYHVNGITGRLTLSSMTEINTVEAGYLIDELHALCAEMGIKTGDIDEQRRS